MISVPRYLKDCINTHKKCKTKFWSTNCIQNTLFILNCLVTNFPLAQGGVTGDFAINTQHQDINIAAWVQSLDHTTMGGLRIWGNLEVLFGHSLIKSLIKKNNPQIHKD